MSPVAKVMTETSTASTSPSRIKALSAVNLPSIESTILLFNNNLRLVGLLKLVKIVSLISSDRAPSESWTVALIINVPSGRKKSKKETGENEK